METSNAKVSQRTAVETSNAKVRTKAAVETSNAKARTKAAVETSNAKVNTRNQMTTCHTSEIILKRVLPVVLATGNQVWNGPWTFGVQPIE